MATIPSSRANYCWVVSPFLIIQFFSGGDNINIVILIGFSLLGTITGGLLSTVSDMFCDKKQLEFPSLTSTNNRGPVQPMGLLNLYSNIRYFVLRTLYQLKTCYLKQIIFGLICGSLFAIIWLRYDLTLQSLILSLYTCFFILIFAIDLKYHIIPNIIVYPSMGLVLLLSCFLPGDISKNVFSSITGGAVAFVIFNFILFISRGKIGGGDIKLSLVIGMATGFPELIVALTFAFFTVGIFAILLMLLKIKSFNDEMPFGPFLTSGAIIALIWGRPLLDWFSALATHS